MIVAVIFLSIIVAVLAVFVILSVRLNLRQQEVIESVHEGLDKALDIVVAAQQRISKTASTPVLSDEPLVRQMVDDVRTVKQSIAQAMGLLFDSFDASKMTQSFDDDEENDVSP